MSEKYKFGINTSGLTAYVDESKTELLYQLVNTAGIMPYAEISTGHKTGTSRIHFMSTSVTLQTDGCANNASGSTPFTEKDITVAAMYDMDTLCMKSLNGFWAQQILAAGSRGEDAIPAEISRAFVEKKLNALKKVIAVADWIGDTASPTANINKYNGLLKQIFADGSTVDGNTTNATGATTVSNILARMQEMYLAIPEDLRDGSPDGGNLVWFLSQGYYDLYIVALRNANLFHHVGGEGTAKYYGTNIDLIPQVGLASTDKMVITTKDNIVIATDLESDEDDIKFWFSDDDNINKYRINFKRGITYKFSNYIVRWGLGAS
jgi:hypothetical protein